MITVENCLFKFRCSMRWTELADLATPDRRFCHKCAKTVHFVTSDEELQARARAGECVALRRIFSYAYGPSRPQGGDILLGALADE
jgi:hypothetical protein